MKLLDMAAEVAPEDDRATRARIQSLRGLALRGGARIDDALAALAAGLALGDEPRSVHAELLHQRAELLLDLYRGGRSVARPGATARRSRRPPHDRAARTDGAAHARGGALQAVARPARATPRWSRDGSERTIELARAAGDQRALALALIVDRPLRRLLGRHRPQAVANLAEAKTITDALRRRIAVARLRDDGAARLAR